MNMTINFLLISGMGVPFFAFCAQESPAYLYVSMRTGLIYQRFYFIKRLHHAVDALQNNDLRGMCFEQLDPLVFQNKVIQNAVFQMKKTGQINSLNELWHAFEGYQYLYDSLFAKEYISLICIIYMIQKSYYISYKSVSIEYLLSYLDYCLDSHNNCFDHNTREKFIKDVMVTDHVAKRYFIIKRLHKVVSFVNRCCYKEPSALSVAVSIQLINQDMYYFQHVRMKEVLKRMSDSYSLEPLLEVWQECLQYRYVSDDLFVKELIRGFLLFYKIFLLQYSFKKVDGQIVPIMNHIFGLYENIDKLPLEEILEILDMATEGLIAIQLAQEGEEQKSGFIYY